MSSRWLLDQWSKRYNAGTEDQLQAVNRYIDNQQDDSAFDEYGSSDVDATDEEQLDDALDYIDRQDSDDAFADALEMYAIDQGWFDEDDEEVSHDR
jgi:hypothetical protein